MKKLLNRKLAMLFFGLGLGIATAPAFADQCLFACSIDYKNCIAAGNSDSVCNAERNVCKKCCADGQVCY